MMSLHLNVLKLVTLYRYYRHFCSCEMQHWRKSKSGIESVAVGEA